MINTPVPKLFTEYIRPINNDIPFVFQSDSINIYVYTLDGRSIFSSVHMLVVIRDKGEEANCEYSRQSSVEEPILYDRSNNSLTLFNKRMDVKAYELAPDGSKLCQSPVHIMAGKFKLKIKPEAKYEILLDYFW